MRFRLGELFSGPGGLACGAINARIGDETYLIEHEWANDYDQDACNTYIRNICQEQPQTVYSQDVRSLNMNRLGSIDALAFGFPCNDFSVVGEQKGINGTFGPLYSYGIKALKKFQPKWFLAENVSGLRSANKGNAFKKILDELRNTGYIITPHLYKFELYGVPQTRHRVIIIGIREDINREEGIAFKVPAPPAEYMKKPRTCRDAIEKPPIPKSAANQELTKQSSAVQRRLSYIKPGENAFTAALPVELQLNIKGARISQIYKRLDPNKPAYTVTGSGGGGTHIYHWEENRALTNRERARLQTFPDDFVFMGSKESVRKQIGMAVPCQGAQIIFEAVLKTFAREPYESIDPNLAE